MTTENSTLISDVNTTTDEVTKKQRSVSELSMLKTYQGMTDAEIQSLIDFYVQMERDALDTKTAQANAIMQANAAAEAYASAAAESVIRPSILPARALTGASGNEKARPAETGRALEKGKADQPRRSANLDYCWEWSSM